MWLTMDLDLIQSVQLACQRFASLSVYRLWPILRCRYLAPCPLCTNHPWHTPWFYSWDTQLLTMGLQTGVGHSTCTSLPKNSGTREKIFLSPLVQKITCSQSTVATLRPLRMTSLLPEQPTVMPWHYPELWRNCNHGHCGIWSALLCQKRLSAVLLTIPEDPPYRWWPCYPFSQLNHEAKVRRECDSS